MHVPEANIAQYHNDYRFINVNVTKEYEWSIKITKNEHYNNGQAWSNIKNDICLVEQYSKLIMDRCANEGY